MTASSSLLFCESYYYLLAKPAGMVVIPVNPVFLVALCSLSQEGIVRLSNIRTPHHQMCTLLPLGAMAIRPKMCTLLPLGAMAIRPTLHLRGLTLRRGTRATSTTSSALTTRRHRISLRRRTGDISSSNTMERAAPPGSSKDAWPLSAAAACWRNAAAASEMLLAFWSILS